MPGPVFRTVISPYWTWKSIRALSGVPHAAVFVTLLSRSERLHVPSMSVRSGVAFTGRIMPAMGLWVPQFVCS